MRTYGSYEAVREIARTGLGQVHAARKVGETDTAYAVKVLDLGAMSFFAEDAALASRVQLFLESAEVQRSAGSGWVPVHQAASSSDIAYVAMDKMALSVGRLVEGRSRVDGNVLVSVAVGVCEALTSIRTQLKRGHGNLKSSNTFFDRSEDLRAARVLLSDPASAGELGSDQGEVSDLRALGELLYQLVEHKPFKALGGWPVPPGPEWNRLGKVGEGWRKLVSELLNPDLKPGQISLSDIRVRAEGLRPPKKRVWPYAAAAAIAIVAVVGGWFVWMNRPLPPLDWNQELWASLVAEDEAWFQPILERVRAGSAVGDEELTQALRTMVDELNARQIPDWIEPSVTNRAPVPGVDMSSMSRAIADLQDRLKGVDKERARLLRVTALPQIVTNWPGATGDGLSTSKPTTKSAETDAMYAIYFGLAVIDHVKVQIHERQESILKELAQLREQGLIASGFESTVKSQIERARVWEQGSGTPLERLAGLASAAEQLDQVEVWWAVIQTGLGEVAKGASGGRAAEDPVLLSFREAMERDLREADERGDVASFVEVGRAWADAIANAGATIAAHGANEIDWQAIPTRDGAMEAYAAAREGRMDAAAFAGWVSIVGDDRYWRVIDPRPEMGAAPILVEAMAAIGGLDEECADAFAGEVSQIQTRIADVRERSDEASGLAWIRMNRDRVEAAANETVALATAIREDAIGLVQTCGRNQQEEIAIWMAEDPTTLTDVQAIAEFWHQSRIDTTARLAPGAGERPGKQWVALRGMRRLLFGERDRQTGALVHEGIAGRLEAWQGPAVQRLPRGWDGGAMDLAVDERRERAALQMLNLIEGWDPVERFERWAGHEEALSSLREVEGQLDAWDQHQEKMAEEFARIETLMTLLYLPDEPPADGEETITACVSRWRADADAVLASVQLLVSEVDRLSEIPRTDRSARIAIAEALDEPAWARVAAWRRLDSLGAIGTADAWPRGEAELRREMAVRVFASREIAKLQDQSRQATLLAESAESGRARWSQALLTGSENDLGAIMSHREAMGVMGTTGLDSRAAWNIELFDFLQGLDGLTEEEARRRGRAFRDRALALDSEVRAQPRIGTLIAKIGQLATEEEVKRSIEEVLDEVGPRDLTNPQLRGKWNRAEVDPSGRGEWVRYTTTSNRLELTFWRVEASSGEPVYILDREISVGMMLPFLLDTAFAPPSERISEIWTQLRDDSRTGVRTWSYTTTTRRLTPWTLSGSKDATPWTPRDPTVRDQPPHAPGIEPGVPTDSSPVQWIEATAAEWIAGRLGSRLPTSDEWRAARRTYEAGSTSWNLRDQTFERQREYVAGMHERGLRYFNWPDEGIFVPRGVSVPREGAAMPAIGGSDGSLWFDAVDRADRGSRLKHLVGNVAEFVNDSPPRPGEQSGRARYGVIGGSALSPAEVDVDTAYPIDGLSGYSDVGFRLAFLAVGAKRPLWRDMADAVGSQPPYAFLNSP